MVRNVLIFCLVLLLGITIVACDKQDETTDSKSKSDNTTTTAKAADQSSSSADADDKAILEANGYTVYLISQSSMLTTTEQNLGAEAGTLTTLLTASRGILNESDEEARVISIYYFSSEAAASACYENSFAGSEDVIRIDSKIVYGDTDNLIQK